MKLYNHKFESFDKFSAYIDKYSIPDSNQVLIQAFISNIRESEIVSALAEIKEVLPSVPLISSTAAGNVVEGKIIDDGISLSISVFENTIAKSISFKTRSVEQIVTHLENKVTARTKLAIVFTNTYRVDSPSLLQELSFKFPQLIVAGGNSADSFKFQKCIVSTNESFDDDVVIALLDSDVLEVHTGYQMHLKAIGSEFTVTKSEGNTIYEINGIPALEFYIKYLGQEVAEDPTFYGISFPLLFSDKQIVIPRGAISCDKERGSLTYAGDVPQGSLVKFGFANPKEIEKANQQDLAKRFQFHNEAAFIYSCAGRRLVFGVSLDAEVKSINEVAPTGGFVTYGEFFHDRQGKYNRVLNESTTFVVLNESPPIKPIFLNVERDQQDMSALRLKALSHLIAETGNELDETIHYLEQFKKSINEAFILSTADEKGNVSSVNQNFVELTGFTEDELLNKNLQDLTEPETAELYRDTIVDSMHAGGMWKGLVKNRKKDGSLYHALVEMSPIYNKDGSLKEYLSVRKDITELQEYRGILEAKLDATTTSLKEKIFYTNQYEDAVNSSIAVIKSNLDYKITYANKKTIELSGYSKEELLGFDSSILRTKDFPYSKPCRDIRKTLANKQRVEKILVNVSKTGEEYTVSNLFIPIVNFDGDVIEYITLMHDITEVALLSNEILATQKEVVFTLGAIGESRSQETGLHVKRVAEYSYMLAKLYGLSDQDSELLKQASPMHDIGKVGISDTILNKPGKLTTDEFEIMKTHAELGYNMLKHSQREILKASAIVAYEHHEKWDGSGYPRGLKGDAIHIYGRITAIADVFDALAHERPYKAAWPINKIVDLFEKERGKHFEPKLLDIFLSNFERFLEVKQQLSQ